MMIGANQARHATVDETIAMASVILFIKSKLLPDQPPADPTFVILERY